MTFSFIAEIEQLMQTIESDDVSVSISISRLHVIVHV